MPSSTPAAQRAAGALGVLAAFGIIAALTFALHARVALSEAPPARGPLPVEATTYTQTQSYIRPRTFLGTVTAGRKSTLGFETGGTLALAPPREGTPVDKGQILARLDQASLTARKEAAEAEQASAESELKLAEIKTRRQRDLLKTGAVSKDIYDETRLGAQALRARVAAASAQVKNLSIELEKTVLTAPYAGIIADRFVYDASVLNPGAPVLTLVETAGKEAHIGVPVQNASELKIGERYPLRLRDRTLDAVLLGLRPDVDPATRSLTALFALPEDTTALDGEPILLELTTSVAVTGGWLPVGALLEGKRGIWTVLTLVPESEGLRAVREAVEVLDVQGDRAYVRGSLADNATVVASGVHRINPGSLVKLAGQR